MKWILGLTCLALAGCNAPQNADTTAQTGGPDTCNASAYQNLIGQDAVVDLSLPEPKRTYRFGDPVTMDFNPARLNIQLDETDTIVAITCG
ncbi:I78 family peptidase inhibitor [Sulfitobacter noctilucae]|uniref:I78 family peptidase inhibitor n=1 Tax=Sulfitobacter noctilucae TaxID=1342302 RepID=UPI00046A8504|nr:I78 family peptidase inhibitor [Sulfitobacter noctilucae]